MPKRTETIDAAINLFEGAKYPGGMPTSSRAWLGVYQVLLWYEAVEGLPNRSCLPHIIDANELRQRLTWRSRAIAVEEYIAQQLLVESVSLPHMVDLLMNLPAYQRLQRNNPLGIAFTGLLKHVLEQMGNHGLTYELEVSGGEAFPGVQIPTRTKKPRIDMLVRKKGQNVGIISTKWSIRHDRVDDLTTECRAYKNAARYTDTRLFYFVVTNEFNPARTEKLIEDKCINGVVHVHKPLVTEVCGLNDRLTQLIDLSDLIRMSHSW